MTSAIQRLQVAIRHIARVRVPAGARQALVVFLSFAQASQPTSFVWPSLDTVAAECGQTERSIRRSVRSLIDAGVLAEHEQDGHTGYLVNLDALVALPLPARATRARTTSVRRSSADNFVQKSDRIVQKSDRIVQKSDNPVRPFLLQEQDMNKTKNKTENRAHSSPPEGDRANVIPFPVLPKPNRDVEVTKLPKQPQQTPPPSASQIAIPEVEAVSPEPPEPAPAPRRKPNVKAAEQARWAAACELWAWHDQQRAQLLGGRERMRVDIEVRAVVKLIDHVQRTEGLELAAAAQRIREVRAAALAEASTYLDSTKQRAWGERLAGWARSRSAWSPDGYGQVAGKLEARGHKFRVGGWGEAGEREAEERLAKWSEESEREIESWFVEKVGSGGSGGSEAS